jgi:uncharacterized protein (TIGR03435 family)
LGLFFHDNLYSIAATTDKPTSKGQMLLMLRRVLAERFQHVLCVSNKIQPVYDLEFDWPQRAPALLVAFASRLDATRR